MPSPPEPPSIAERALAQARAARRLLERRTGRAGRFDRLFRGADGALTPDARDFLADVARLGMVHGTTFHPDARVHAMNEGRRMLALEILAGGRLDSKRVAALTRQIMEAGDE